MIKQKAICITFWLYKIHILILYRNGSVCCAENVITDNSKSVSCYFLTHVICTYHLKHIFPIMYLQTISDQFQIGWHKSRFSRTQQARTQPWPKSDNFQQTNYGVVHQIVSPISNSESTNLFTEYLIWYLFQLSNWEKTPVLYQ